LFCANAAVIHVTGCDRGAGFRAAILGTFTFLAAAKIGVGSDKRYAEAALRPDFARLTAVVVPARGECCDR
jgi:hypothetical protein